MATNPPPGASLDDLRDHLAEVSIADAVRLRRRLDAAARTRDPARQATELARLAPEVEAATAQLAQRRLVVPEIRYPDELPVSQRRDEIAAAVADHQVVIVAGETGSGKTTQLPKICLGLGRGVRGMIGHTQPRRLAARTVADRISSELGTELGGAVGYAVRFTDRVGPDTLVKLMTDGILLTDIHRDRDLSAYDTLIIDEAHERSLNIDFILGYLKQLLPRRPDLKVIVTSATIDPERFSQHFDGAPIIEVSGRAYPVEVRYRPLDPPAVDQLQGICDAIEELRVEPPGDILVFLSGEREIRDAAEAVRGLRLRDTEVLPLYARLSPAEQHRVFASHPGRRIVLATNVAETSLTVPGIRYVIDPGTARISRYSHRLKVQRLPIEAVSQASANQRAGRCGRVAPGICIRLYDEDDFDARPAFTEPEILRTNLASVILQMTWLGLGNIAAFPFVEPPDRRAITDGVRLLQELGALETGTRDEHHRLTPVGRQLARLPIDPRFGRMVLEADRNGCLREVLIIAAGLSIEDPRERPAEKAAAADELHARFAEDGSDFLAYLNLWRYVREEQRARSSNQFRKLCRAEHLNHLRIREWQDVHAQLRRVVGELGLRQGGRSVDPDQVHRALLAGLLSHIGQRDRETREFRGARGSRFAIFPGSVLAKKPPPWVMAAELVETSRLWGRTAARIEPEWAEELGGHLTKHSYTEPHWSTSRGAAMVYENVTLYGLPVVTRRLVGYHRIDAEHARELFLRHALVEGDWRTHHPMFAANREVLAEVEALEHRFRQRGLLVDDDTLYRLYDERIPAKVVSGRHFDSWWKKVRRTRPELLTFTPELFLVEDAPDLDPADFPDQWTQGALTFRVTYAFDPGGSTADDVADGVTVHVPVAVLNQVRADGFDWQVPGLRREKVEALIRSLPKTLRRDLVPIPETAERVLEQVEPGAGPLLDGLARELGRIAGVRIDPGDWDLDKVAPHLTVTFLVEDDTGHGIAEGTDLDALRRLLAPELRATVAEATRDIERSGRRQWDFGTIPPRLVVPRGGQEVITYPALVDEGDTVALRAFDGPDEQFDEMWAGTRRLVRLTVPMPARAAKRRLGDGLKLAIVASPYASLGALVEACLVAALDALMDRFGAPVWDAVAFDELRARVHGAIESEVLTVADLVVAVLQEAAVIDRRLAEPVGPMLIPAYDDLAGQRAALLHAGFITAAGGDRLPDVVRYLRAMTMRLDAVTADPRKDRERMHQVHQVEQAYGKVVDRFAGGAHDAELERIGWGIEELRVHLFAQRLGTAQSVSATRLLDAITAIERAG